MMVKKDAYRKTPVQLNDVWMIAFDERLALSYNLVLLLHGDKLRSGEAFYAVILASRLLFRQVDLPVSACVHWLVE